MVLSLSGLMDEWSQARTKKKFFGADGSPDTVGRMCGRDPSVLICKGERGNKPYEIELLLRLYVLQNLYTLSDDRTVAEMINSRAFSDFCGIDSSN